MEDRCITISALSAVRVATHDVHLELEKQLHIAQPTTGRAEYLAYLAALYGWLAPFEAQLWDAPWPVDIDAAGRAAKRLWIEDDLRAAGWTDAAFSNLTVSPYQPQLASMPERFGIAYVIEGAQLGTQVLRKALTPQLGDWSPRWLQGYGRQTASKWKTFIACLDGELTTPSEQAAAALAARSAFVSLAAWLKQQGVA